MDACSSDDMMTWFEELAMNAGSVQNETLKRILEMNHGVEYLKQWLGDVDVHNMDAQALQSLYRSVVPLASHADLDPYIQRIADGETTPLLTKQPITTLSLRYLIIPYTSILLESFCLFFIINVV